MNGESVKVLHFNFPLSHINSSWICCTWLSMWGIIFLIDCLIDWLIDWYNESSHLFYKCMHLSVRLTPFVYRARPSVGQTVMRTPHQSLAARDLRRWDIQNQNRCGTTADVYLLTKAKHHSLNVWRYTHVPLSCKAIWNVWPKNLIMKKLLVLSQYNI